MKILAIESSCDETSAAVIDDKLRVLSLVISSQIPIHAKFSGVVPELASRAHIQNINLCIDEALAKAGIAVSQDDKTLKSFDDEIDAIAVTKGPGLAGSLLVGVLCADTLASVYKKPLIGVNHIEGHLYSSFIEHKNIKPPFLAMIISGGHTEIILAEDFCKYKIIGSTRDDAAGEAFDKAGKMLGLTYPGGPEIDKHANSKNANSKAVFFSRPMLKSGFDFSFSGIKTALLNYLKKNPIKNEAQLNDICASFREAICETLCVKAFNAAEKYNVKTMVLGGGVCANSLIRSMFQKTGKARGIKVFMPSLLYCSDNAAMIGAAGFFNYKKGAASRDISIMPSFHI
jgi:N6-L-threonylcarbamoyladenine synthase